MLKTSAPYPHVGSYALLEDEGRTHLVRIIGKDPGGDVTLSFPGRYKIASGNKTVPFADLIDGTPLTAAEEAEFRQLESTIPAVPSRSAKVKAQQQRYADLRERSIHASTLARLLAKAQRHGRIAA